MNRMIQKRNAFKEATVYFQVKVQFDNKKENISNLIKRVSAYNDCRGKLAFDCVTADGCFDFVYAAASLDDDTDALGELADLHRLFGDNFTAQIIEPSMEQKEKLQNIDKQVYFRGDYLCEERWCLRTETQILTDLAALEYDELKKFVQKLSCYLKNVKQNKSRGNYNIVFVTQDNDFDKQSVIQAIYDLYCAHNIITHYAICETSLNQALSKENDTALLINIDDEWQLDQQMRFGVQVKSEQILGLNNHKSIYITFINADLYHKLQQNSAFNLIFPHKILLPATSRATKLQILISEAKEYGFTLAEDFTASALLDLPLADLRQRLIQNITQALYKTEYKNVIQVDAMGNTLIKQEVVNNCWNELEAMIGMENVKKCIKELACFLERRGRKAVPSLHMVFRGNPGTGKTTVARLLGKILCEIGILQEKAPFVEVERKDLIARYVGHTAIQTAQKVAESRGGILFIDEAYALNQNDTFSHEAIATLVKQMEDHRDDFICIMAGYSVEMNQFLDVNPGMRERVQFYIDFPDYSAEELSAIFKEYCQKANYKLLPKAEKQVQEDFRQLVLHKDKNFANARLVRKIFDRVRLKQAVRSESNEISEADIQAAFAEKDMQTYLYYSKRVYSIGFVV